MPYRVIETRKGASIMSDQTYTMHIETDAGVTQHGFHLGTDLRVATQFALEALKRDNVLSVALRVGPKSKLVQIFDWRDAEDQNELMGDAGNARYLQEY